MLVLGIALLQSLSVAASLFALSSAAGRWLKLEPWRALFAGLIALGLIGFLQFWATFLSAGLTLPLQIAFFAAVAALIALSILRRRDDDTELLTPCLLVFAASVLLALFTFAGATPDDLARPLSFIETRWTTQLSSDPEIPWVFAEQLRQGQIVTPFYGDWLSSDRPPLQTGLYLLLNLGSADRLWYQACASALQLTSLAAVWALVRASGLDRRWALLAAIAIAVTPLTITNGSYVWPKMLSVAFVCGVFALHLHADRARPLLGGSLAGLAAALAMLAHGSSAFALIGIALVALIARNIGALRHIIAGVVSVAILYAPWAAYQRWYDPPGDRLLKWHLAGIVNPTPRPFPEVLQRSYSFLTPKSWAYGRQRNLAGIAGVPNLPDMPPPANTSAGKLRNYALGTVAAGMGLFGLALYAFPALLIPRASRLLTLSASLTLLVWALLIYGPGQTMAKNGSYFPQLALILAVIQLLAILPRGRMVALILLAAQAIVVGGLYVLP